MASKLLKKIHSRAQLDRAWRAIRSNARDSESEDVRNEVKKFSQDESRHIGSLVQRLSRKKFKFEAAKGVPIPKQGSDGKKSKDKFRPIVLAPLESRIVQRSILESLTTHPAFSKYVNSPHSFGGLRRQKDQKLSAVPAAIEATLVAIQNGARYVASADISAFFTRISKSSVRAIVSEAVGDEEFMALFDEAIKVELANLASLHEKAKAFPIENIGVAQGNSLSPLLGNIILYEFDIAMNEGDCRCVRYIDDFIILAPTYQAASSRMRKAKKILSELGMALSPEKSSKTPVSIRDRFEFLGVELNNGLIRPNSKSRSRLFTQIDKALDTSIKAFRQFKGGYDLPKTQSLVDTLKRLDGVVQGWGKHYRFCNDRVLLRKFDDDIKAKIRAYLGTYTDIRNDLPGDKQQQLLGVEQLENLGGTPFEWPTIID